MSAVIDTRDLEYLGQDLYKIQRNMLGETKKFVRQEGDKLRRRAAKEARKRVRKTAVHRKGEDRHAGTYHKAFKRGKVVDRGYGQVTTRVYSTDRVAHLIEDGWRPKDRNQKSHEKVQGKKVLNDASQNFKQEFEEDIGIFVDRVLYDLEH